MNDTRTEDLRLLERLARHAPRGRSVTALAHEFGVGPARLRRSVGETCGMSPGAFLDAQRVASARRLAARGDADPETVLRLTGATGRGTLDPAAVQAQGDGPIRVFLPARPPFAHAALANFFRMRCMPVVEHFEDGEEPAYGRAWRSRDGAGRGLFRLLPDGVVLEIEGRGTIPLRDLLRRAERMFDLDAPVEDVRDRFRADPILGRAVASEPGRRVPGNWDPFELAVRAVLGQQVSVAAARTHADRLLELLGVDGPDALFPTPAELAGADLGALAMPASRRETIRTLAAAVAEGRVDLELPPDEVRAQLLALRGIGPWTADYVAMRGLKDRDAFPAGDLVVRQALAGGSRKLPTEAEVRSRAEAWRPLRAYAAL
ncbi:MAG: AlkA N-terminal domain-containing protein, partial [Pseudomonadales bacterium]|nr:AlkA N-terminal domain-containing protein [Pseudomonadales bacterium]